MHVFESLLKPSRNDQNNPISPYLLLTKFRAANFGQPSQFKLSLGLNYVVEIENHQWVEYQILSPKSDTSKQRRVDFNRKFHGKIKLNVYLILKKLKELINEEFIRG